MIGTRNSVLKEVMERNGVTIAALAEKMFGDASKTDKIELILDIRDRSEKQTKAAIIAAGGTDEDAAQAACELKAYRDIVQKLDDDRNAAVSAAIANAHAEHDVIATDAWNPIHAQGKELLKKEKEEAEKKAASKAKKDAAKAETVLEGTETAAPAGDSFVDPFNE